MQSRLILASGSPRRRELLDQIGVRYRVTCADIDERQYAGEAARDYVQRMAMDKAAAVLSREGPGRPILAADTIVVLDGVVLGKPCDAGHAAEILRRLSGRTHEVMSAVVLLAPGAAVRRTLNVSRVTFAPLDDDWISAYCASGEPLDKAGAYAIQGLAAQRIERLEGSFSGVMGLPLYETSELLRAAGLLVQYRG
jgi:septum formation protein